MAEWTRHGDCGGCGWCCTHVGMSVAQVANPAGLSDPAYYRQRGFLLQHREGQAVQAMRRVWLEARCPVLGANGCTVYADRPRTCQEFPTSPAQILGTPCTYWFTREHNGQVETQGGLGSPYPTEE